MERRLTDDWEAPPGPPLALEPGDMVAVGERAAEWPSYLRCTAPDGTAGWVPEEVLEVRGRRGTARRGYTTRELTAPAGARVEALWYMAEWWWCRDGAGNEGWLPERVLGSPGA
jgi:hypothetical protein